MRATWGGVATTFYVLIPVLITISAILERISSSSSNYSKLLIYPSKRYSFPNATFCKNTREENEFDTLSIGFQERVLQKEKVHRQEKNVLEYLPHWEKRDFREAFQVLRMERFFLRTLILGNWLIETIFFLMSFQMIFLAYKTTATTVFFPIILAKMKKFRKDYWYPRNQEESGVLD